MLLSGAAQAMTLVQFKTMNTDDQAEYVADLIVGASYSVPNGGAATRPAKVEVPAD